MTMTHGKHGSKLWHTPAKKRTPNVLARRYKKDTDDVLIALWDFHRKPKLFSYLENANSVIKIKHFRLAEEIVAASFTPGDARQGQPAIGPVKLILKSFDFSKIGEPYDSISFITRDEVLRIHEQLATDFEEGRDPISPSGLKDGNLLDAALFHPQTAYEGYSKYSTVETTAAALMYAISHNHAFHNGNKRTAIVAMLVFLNRYSICLTCSEDVLFKISLDVANHRIVSDEYRYPDAEIYELAKWIHANSRVINKSERPLSLRKLRHLLANYECEISSEGKISRSVTREGYFGTRRKVISAHRNIPSTWTEGEEVSPGFIRSIRKDLLLDPEHGIDSDTFYSGSESTSSEFITQYSNLLRRLSRI